MLDYRFENGDIVFGADAAFVTGNEATAQRLRQKFGLWRGEWFLDASAGVPWLQDVLGQRPRPEVLQAVVRGVVQDDPGIAALLSLDLELQDDRHLRISFRASATNGAVIEMEIDL